MKFDPPTGKADQRRRSREPGAIGKKHSFVELCSVREPHGAIDHAIRNAQIDALIRLVPAILGGQFAAGTLLVAAMFDSVPHGALITWWLCVAGLCLWRSIRALRLRDDADYLRRRPVSARS